MCLCKKPWFSKIFRSFFTKAATAKVVDKSKTEEEKKLESDEIKSKSKGKVESKSSPPLKKSAKGKG